MTASRPTLSADFRETPSDGITQCLKKNGRESMHPNIIQLQLPDKRSGRNILVVYFSEIDQDSAAVKLIQSAGNYPSALRMGIASAV